MLANHIELLKLFTNSNIIPAIKLNIYGIMSMSHYKYLLYPLYLSISFYSTKVVVNKCTGSCKGHINLYTKEKKNYNNSHHNITTTFYPFYGFLYYKYQKKLHTFWYNKKEDEKYILFKQKNTDLQKIYPIGMYWKHQCNLIVK